MYSYFHLLYTVNDCVALHLSHRPVTSYQAVALYFPLFYYLPIIHNSSFDLSVVYLSHFITNIITLRNRHKIKGEKKT